MSKMYELIQGLCPDGVEFRNLGSIASAETGTQLNKTSMTVVGDYPVLNGGINPSGYYHFYNTEDNTIAISQGGASAGYVNFMETKFWAGAHCFVVKPTSGSILNKYLYYVLKEDQVKLMNAKLGAGIPGLNKKKITGIQIPIPTLPIQQEIVNILDKFTELEAKLEAKLEAELEARKKQYDYYRNQLLTPTEIDGKWYLNGKEVELKTFGEIGQFIRGNGIQKKDFRETGIGCIHYGQIHTFYGTYAYTTKTFVSEEHAKKLRKAKKGDLVIATTSEDTDGVCKAVAWLGDKDVAVSGDSYIFNHNQNAKYIAYLFRTIMFYEHKKKYVTGTKVIRVSGSNISRFMAPIPALDEQERIVTILDKFDALVNDISIVLPAEIEARRKQYEYYRNKLLTFKNIAEKQDS